MEINFTQLLEAYRRITNVSHYHIFIILVALDLFTGYIKAVVTKDIDSKVGLTGVLKHLSIVGTVLLICPYLWILGYIKIGLFLIYSISLTYVISIIENIDIIQPGVIPLAFGEFFRRIKKDVDKFDISKLDKGGGK